MRILRRFLARVKNSQWGAKPRIRHPHRGGSDTWQRYGRCVPSGSGPDTHRHLCVGAALPAARALTQLLFGISPLDATSFCSSVVLLGLMSVAACVIPALRSVRLDPVRALRSE